MRLLTLILSLLCINTFAELAPAPEDDIEHRKVLFADWKVKADQGDALHQRLVGNCFAKGLCGVEQNHIESVKYYQKSADQGDAWSQLELAGCYVDGKGVERNLVKAYAYYSLTFLSNDIDVKKRAESRKNEIVKEMTYIQTQAALELREILQGEMVRAGKKLAVTLNAEIEAKKNVENK